MMQAEVRGRGNAWTVWTPDEALAPMPVPLYDEDGILKETLMCGAPPDGEAKLIQRRAHGGPFASMEEALEYAHYLGHTDVKVVKTQTREQALAKARQARQKEAR